jgi:hypothetical protein
VTDWTDEQMAGLASDGVVVACCLRHRIVDTAHEGLEPGCLVCRRQLAEAAAAEARWDPPR